MPTMWFGTASRVRSNQNADIWLSTAPLPGTGVGRTTSNAEILSVATMSMRPPPMIVSVPDLAAVDGAGQRCLEYRRSHWGITSNSGTDFAEMFYQADSFEDGVREPQEVPVVE